MIKLSAADLNYLLQQVNIGNDYGQLGSPLDPLGLREVSGQNNNLVGGFTYNADGTVTWTAGDNLHSDWGQADTDFLRMFATDHPTNGTSYGFTFDPVTMQVVDSGDGSPIVDANGNAVLVPADFMTQMMESALPAPGTSPRTVTQLIASSDVDPASPTYNPAAAAAMAALGGQPVDVANTVVGSTQTAEIPNPGILGGVPYNEWFVAFGQFFDHGLDFITKGGGYVLIPLSPSDPLYDPAKGAQGNMMMLSRGALSNPDSDFTISGSGNAVLNADATPLFNNSTGLLIDQSQTYGSHASVNVLLRQYDDNGVITGKLITSAEDMAPGDTGYDKALHDLATWADMKVNAARLGIALIDSDVLDAPLIKADGLGHYAFTAQHDVMYRSDMSIADMGTDYNAENDPFVRWTAADAAAHRCTADQVGEVRFCNQAILSDIANGASPMSPMGTLLDPKDAFTDLTGLIPGINYYDPDALAAHYVSGDHRANENVGLTAVHHVFHEEHNIQSDTIMLAAVQDAVDNGNIAALDADQDGWLATHITQGELDALVAAHTTVDGVDYQAIADALTWDGEKVYQAARIITESEYNHVAIDQYVGGLVVLPEFVSYSSDVNLDISLEFSQAVFRLGHSQLAETMKIALPNATGNPGDPGFVASEYKSVGLFDAFLNPALYNAEGAAAITLGLMNQQGNEIDEFVTASMQQSLVGVPLDLPALNIARGRDVGLPTLNELRQQIFDGLVQNTNNASNPGIAPYTSWEDFGGHLRTPESLVNFIAAYGREDAVFGLDTMRRAYEAGTLSGTDSKGGFDATALDPTPGDGVITLQDLRANAQIILDAAAVNPNAPAPVFETQAEQDYYDLLVARHDDAVMFMRGQGSPTYDPVTHTWDQNNTGGGDQGFWDIDLWIGGLAEQPLFDGPLGTTFTFVMEDFGQRMQDGDRFYYLYRMPVGHHLGDQIIGEQFADLIQRTTGLEHTGDAFGYQSGYYILDGYVNHTDATDGYIDNPFDGTIGIDDQYGVNDYFNSIYENLPDSVKAFVVANNSFQVDSTATGGAGVNTEPTYGNYIVGAPTGWDLTGTGGVLAPTDAVVASAGHTGGNVAWMNPGAVLSQDLGETIVDGNTYTFTVNLGNRSDPSQNGGFSATVHLVDANGHVVAERLVTEADVPNGEWRPISLSGAAGAMAAGGSLHVEIINTGAEQVLVDNVNVTVTEPGGSANDGHTVIAGLEGDDYLIAGLGDDYVYGDAGNDIIEGAQGNDHLYGGAGDDWITDYENDDFIHGGDGDDYISAGPGVLDTSHGGNGDDEVHGGDGVDEVYGDDGNDRLYGDGDTDLIMGGDGDDYMDGGDSVDEMFGGNGNDWMRGGVGDDNINGGSGNDLMEGGLGPTANDGDRLNGDTAPGALPVIEFNGDGTEGDMDIASYENVTFAITASLQDANANGTSSNLLDTYALVEGLVGSAQADTLTGADADGTAGNGVNNYLIGGGGNDILAGLGDDDGQNGPGSMDFIFGDSVLVDNELYWIGDDRHDPNNVIFTQSLAEYRAETGHTHATAADLQAAIANGWQGDGYIEDWYGTGETRVVLSADNGATVTLGHILGDHGAEGTMDTAVYRGNYSSNPADSDYKVEYITMNGQQAVKITDLRPATDENGNPIARDGVDILVGVEKAQFANGTVSLVMTPPTLDLHGADVGNLRDNFNNSSWTNSDGSIPWTTSWSEDDDSGGVTGGQIRIDGGTNQLRLYDDGNGAAIHRSFDLTGASDAVLSFDYSESRFDSGERVDASVSFDGGATWHALPGLTLNSNTGSGGSYSVDLSGLLGSGESFGSNAIVKFEAVTANGGNGSIRIDNLDIAISTPVDDGSNDWAASFTENGPEVAIASGPVITDDGTQIVSAKVVLTNAKAGDVIREHGVNGDGISGSVSSSNGMITLTLSGAATLAAYQAAIARVTFENTSNNPDTTPRVIQVTVNDGQADSNLATTTIDVVNLPDPPQLNNDSIIANTSSFSVPTWALLANDQGESSLAVTDVSENSGSFSAVLNGSNIDVTKTTTSNRSFTYTATDAYAQSDTASASVSIDSNGIVSGTNGDNILIGNGANSIFDAGRGNDIVLAGGGNDTIEWNVSGGYFLNLGSTTTDGRDFVDGGGGTDTFVVTSTVSGFWSSNSEINEAFDIYTRDAAGTMFGELNTATEIVVTRNGEVIAELAGVEEIVINTGDGNDIVTPHGNFSGTSLNYSTITVNGGDGDDSVDITGLTSDHRIVFHGGGGTNQVIGDVRPQDVVDNVSAPTDTGSDSQPTIDDDNQGQTDQGDDVPTTPAPAAGDHVQLGTDAADVLLGTTADDVIGGLGGDDLILGSDGADTLKAGGGDDLVKAGAGNDVVFGNDGDDDLFGGAGHDMLFGDAGNDRIFGDGGNDVIEGGAGHDTVYGGAGNDTVLATADDGDDVYWGEGGQDTLDYSAIAANLAVDLGSGTQQHGSVVSTESGNDTVFGFENVIAGSGDDTIVASDAVNTMDGGGGDDTFVFHTTTAADGDVIRGFQPGDKIDLSGIDADSSAGGQQSFVLYAGTGFTAAGQIIVSHENQDGVDHTVVAGNVSGGTGADFTIDLVGHHDLTAADFQGVN